MWLCTRASEGATRCLLVKQGSQRNRELRAWQSRSLSGLRGCGVGPSWARWSLGVSFVAWTWDGTYPSESPGGGGEKLISCRRSCLGIGGDKDKGIHQSRVKAGDREGWRLPGLLQTHLRGQLHEAFRGHLQPLAAVLARCAAPCPVLLMLLCHHGLASSSSSIHCI